MSHCSTGFTAADPAMAAAYLHIPKTGGTAIRSAIESAGTAGDSSAVRYFGHGSSLDQLREHDVVFVIRDPIERVISAFYSRRRMGRPRYNSAHTPGEAVTFGRWPELEPLIRDVAAGDPDAQSAWQAVPHLRPLSAWLVDTEAIEAASIAYIAHLPTLDREWLVICGIWEISEASELPTSTVAAHRAPERPPDLSQKARNALRLLLEDDYRLYSRCLDVRDRRGWG